MIRMPIERSRGEDEVRLHALEHREHVALEALAGVGMPGIQGIAVGNGGRAVVVDV